MYAHRPLYTLLTFAALSLGIVPNAHAQEAAQPATQEATYTWTYNYRKGMTYRTRFQGNFYINLPSGIGFGMEMKGAVKNEVRGVKDNGDIIFVHTREFSEMSRNGRPIEDETPSATRVVQVMNKLGLIVDRKVERASGGDFFDTLSLLTSSFPLPPGPVKVGESWTFQRGIFLTETRKATLLGKETIGGVPTLAVKIEVTFPPRPGTEEKEPARAEYTYNVDPKAGVIKRVIALMDHLYSREEEGRTFSGDMVMTMIQDKAPASAKKTPIKKKKRG
jgi:hypothetical protein